jgi:hypothetical protein
MDDLVQHGLNGMVPEDPSRAVFKKAQTQYDNDELRLLREQRDLQRKALLGGQKIHELGHLRQQAAKAVVTSFKETVATLQSLGIDPTLLSGQLISLHNQLHSKVEGVIDKYDYDANRR